MKRAILIMAVLALLLSGGGQATAATNLIVNGGFETGDFTGWTVNAGATFVTGPFDGYNPHSGNYFAALGNVGNLGYLSQTVSDTAGQTYTLSLYYASNGTTPNEFNVQYNGVTLFDQTNIPPTGPSAPYPYVNLSFNVVGTGSDTISISERDDPAYLALDDVSFSSATAVPEPSSLALMGMGVASLLGYGRLRRRKAA